VPDITGYVPESITEKHRKAVHRSRQLLDSGRSFRQSEREDAWRQSEAQYEGNHWSRVELEDPTADLITINVSFSTVNTIIPYVTSEEPRFLVEPFSANATAKNARLQQAMLNRAWRKARGQAAVKVSALDYLVYGDGWLKPSYAIVDEIGEDGAPISKAEIYVDRVSPWDVWVDPLATGAHDARWIAQRITLSRRELEKDERYPKDLLDELPWGTWNPDGDHSHQDRTQVIEAAEDESYINIIEFYDRIDQALYVFPDHGDDIVLRVVEGIECPLIPLPNYLIPGSPYHMGELEQLWPMQVELNKTRSQLITHRRRNIGKYFYRQGALSEEGISALQSPIVGEAIEVLGDTPLDAVVKPAALAALSPEAYNSADQAMRDIYEISGVNEYLRGATPEIRRTATEASIIEGASNVKTRAKLADIEECIRAAGEYLLAIMREVFPETDFDEQAMYLTGPEAEQIARMDAAEKADSLAEAAAPPGEVQAALDGGVGVQGVVASPGPEIFVGEYSVEVESGSTEMRNPIFKEQKWREMANSLVAMAPQLQQLGVQLNLRKVLEMWFEAAGIADVEGMFEAAAQGGMGLPPELEAIMGGGHGQHGGGTPEGDANIAGVQPPGDPLTALNTGAMPPAA